MAYIKMTDVVKYLSTKDPVEKAFLGLTLKLQIARYFGVGLDIAESYLTQAEQAYGYGVRYLWEDFYSTLTSEESRPVNHISGTLNNSFALFNIDMDRPVDAMAYYVKNRGKHRSDYKLENILKFDLNNGKLDFTQKPESPIGYMVSPKKDINIEFTSFSSETNPGIKALANNMLRILDYEKIKEFNVTKNEILEVMFGNAENDAKKYGIETWQYIDMLSRIFLELINETEEVPFVLDSAVSADFRDTKLFVDLAYSVDGFKLLLQSLTEALIKLKEVGNYQVSVKKWLEGLFELFLHVPGVVFFEHVYPEFIDWDAYSNTILKLENLDVN